MKTQRNQLEKIVLEIQNNPGIRFRELARICHMPNSTMAYYTNKLERLGTVKVKKKANECRFFSSHINSNEKPVIIALRKRSQRKILFLLRKSHLFSDICKATGHSPSTISEKLDMLESLGIIEERILHRRRKMFKIKDLEKTMEIIKKYQHMIKITEP